MAKSFKQLNLMDRLLLGNLHQAGYAQNYIAKQLGVSPSTISRELKRNADEHGNYDLILAHTKRIQRSKRFSKIETNPMLKDYVIDYLKEGWSPEQIAGRLNTQTNKIFLNHESIYQYIYSEEGKKLKLFKYLRTKRKKRYTRNFRKKRTTITNRTSIHERTDQINNRSEFGHWEGDLLMFKKSVKTNLITLRERLSRYVFTIKNPSKQSKDVVSSIKKFFGDKNKEMFKSLTLDNGTEFCGHQEFAKFLNNSKTYFCDPYKSYQKGSIENANKFLREYFPRNIAIDNLDQHEIDRFTDLINNRPMKCLNYQKPKEIFRTALAA